MINYIIEKIVEFQEPIIFTGCMIIGLLIIKKVILPTLKRNSQSNEETKK